MDIPIGTQLAAYFALGHALAQQLANLSRGRLLALTIALLATILFAK